MAAVLVSAAGSPAANSYASHEQAETYMAERETDAAWAGASEDARTRALTAATRRLDRMTYTGCRATTPQALQWPRAYVRDPDATVPGTYVACEVIPARLVRAQCEWAYTLLDAGTSGGATGLDAFKSVVVGPLEIEMRDGAGLPSDATPPAVLREVAPFLAGGRGTVRLVRG